MIPDFNDFHIAIGFTVGYGTPSISRGTYHIYHREL